MDEQRELVHEAAGAMLPPHLLERLSQASDYALTLAPSFKALSPAAKAVVAGTALLTLIVVFRVLRTIVGVALAVVGTVLRIIASLLRGRRKQQQQQQQQPQRAKAATAATTATASRGKGGVRRRGNAAAAAAAEPEEEEQQQRQPEATTTAKPSPPGMSLKALARAAAASKKKGGGGAAGASSSSAAAAPCLASPLHLSWLKGHGDGIASLCFSADGAFLLSASRDRGLRQWPMMTTAAAGAGAEEEAFSSSSAAAASPLRRGAQPTPAQPRTRTLGVSPLAAAFVGGDPSRIAVLSRDGINGPSLSAIPGFSSASGKKSNDGDGDAPLWLASPVPLIAGRRPVALLASSSSSKTEKNSSNAPAPPPLLAVASEKTELEAFDAATGARTSAADTGGLRTHGACCSLDGSALAVATFASDAKVYYYYCDASGPSSSSSSSPSAAVLKKAPLSLSHSGQVLAVALSADGSAAATSSRDGTWSSWKLPPPPTRRGGKGSAASGERAEATRVGSWRQDLPPGEFYRLLSMSPDGSVVAAAAGGDLHFLCAKTGALLEAVCPAHGGIGSGGGSAGDGEVTALCWAPFKRRVVFGEGEGEGGEGESSSSLRWILASGGDDRAVRLWAAPAAPGEERSSGWERGV